MLQINGFELLVLRIMLFLKCYSTKELKGTQEQSHFKFETILFVLLCGP